jgi:hypothetical protein
MPGRSHRDHGAYEACVLVLQLQAVKYGPEWTRPHHPDWQ